MAEPGRRALSWAAGATVVVVAGLALGWGDDGRDGPWVATYRASTGQTVTRHESDVRVHWGQRAPQPGWPVDGFSQRFETCVQAPSPRRVTLVLGADDAAGVWVEGRALLERTAAADYWEARVAVTFDEARRPLRVESVDRGGASSVELWLEDDQGQRSPLPPAWLSRPPCR